jgi:23S rRNA pseudouridine2605 synthase
MMRVTMADDSERLQKLLAGAGHGSRRAIEDWIRAGRVTVNGRAAQLGDRGRAGDDIRLDGQPLALQGAHGTEVLLYHKPLGEMTTRSDPQGRPTVFDRLPPASAGRWISVGRLDVNTSGLLLFTSDGELAHALMHPSSEVEREYLVRLRGHPDAATLERLQLGIRLDDGMARFDRLTAVGDPERLGIHGHAWYRVVLHEGRNREVRRLWLAAGHEVSRLSRLRYGPIELPADLRGGQWRLATPEQIQALRAAATARAPH